VGKQWKVGHGDSEPLTPEARTMENSFQVPSVSSTSTRPGPGQGPPHSQASPMNINHHSIHHSQHHHHPPPPPPPPPHHLHHNLHHNVSSVPPHSTGASSSGSWEQNSSSSDKGLIMLTFKLINYLNKFRKRVLVISSHFILPCCLFK